MTPGIVLLEALSMYPNNKHKMRLDFSHKCPEYEDFQLEFLNNEEYDLFLAKFSYLQE